MSEGAATFEVFEGYQCLRPFEGPATFSNFEGGAI